MNCEQAGGGPLPVGPPPALLSTGPADVGDEERGVAVTVRLLITDEIAAQVRPDVLQMIAESISTAQEPVLCDTCGGTVDSSAPVALHVILDPTSRQMEFLPCHSRCGESLIVEADLSDRAEAMGDVPVVFQWAAVSPVPALFVSTADMSLQFADPHGSVDAVASLLLEAGMALVTDRSTKVADLPVVDSMLFVVGGGVVRLLAPSGDTLCEERIADLRDWAGTAITSGTAALLYIAGGLGDLDELDMAAAAVDAVADGNLIGGLLPVLLAVGGGCR